MIDFVKNAGSKLFGKDKEEAPKPDPTALARQQTASNARRSELLTARAAGLGAEIEALKVTVDGDKAVVTGTAKSQSDREKVVIYVGNTHGIAQVDDRIVVNVPEPEAVFYTVVSGDSLSKIAKAHYGNAMKYTVIFEANKPMLSDPDKIYPGQMLRIPAIED